jgi:hypothetical protein
MPKVPTTVGLNKLIQNDLSLPYQSSSDSAESALRFRTLLIVLGIAGEEYTSALRKKVRRGLHGRVQQGCTSGGRCYEYESDSALAYGNDRRLLGK